VVLVPVHVGEERREVARHVHGVVGGERAREDADQAHATDVLVAGGLHDLGDQDAVGVTRDGARLLARRREHVRGRVLERRREPVDGEVEQLGTADATHRAHRYDGVEAAPGHRLLEVVGQGLVRDLLTAQVAVHQRLVLGLLDDALDQGTPEVLVLAVVVHQVDEPGDLAATVADRDVERKHLVPERRLRRTQDAVVVGASLVELGDHDGPRHADLGTLPPQRGGGVVDGLTGGDHEEGTVGRSEPGPHLTHEVGEPRGVDEVDLGVAVDDRGDGQGDGALVRLLGVLEVADRRALLDGARPGDGSGGGEQRLDQGGLAGSARSDQHDVPDPVGAARPEILARWSTPARLVRHAQPPGLSPSADQADDADRRAETMVSNQLQSRPEFKGYDDGAGPVNRAMQAAGCVRLLLRRRTVIRVLPFRSSLCRRATQGRSERSEPLAAWGQRGARYRSGC